MDKDQYEKNTNFQCCNSTFLKSVLDDYKALTDSTQKKLNVLNQLLDKDQANPHQRSEKSKCNDGKITAYIYVGGTMSP